MKPDRVLARRPARWVLVGYLQKAYRRGHTVLLLHRHSQLVPLAADSQTEISSGLARTQRFTAPIRPGRPLLTVSPAFCCEANSPDAGVGGDLSPYRELVERPALDRGDRGHSSRRCMRPMNGVDRTSPR
jgi:hypothetical protein